MLGTNWMEVLVLVGTIGVGATVVVYLALRMFVWSKTESSSLEHIRNHSLWTGIIAWAFSALTGAGSAGVVAPDQFHAAQDPWSIMPWNSLLIPATAVVAVHAIGQATWPAPKSARRMAVLEFRRARNYVQPLLGWTVLGVFVFSAAILATTFFAPGFDPSTPATATENHHPSATIMGRVPGYVLATALTTAFAILTAGTVLVMRLIARRRSLESLTLEQNKSLRSIGMNRLLRISATVAAGLASIAGEFLARPAPTSGITSWTNWAGLVNMAVLVVMLFWKPAFLDFPTDDAGYNVVHVPGGSAPPNAGDGLGGAKLSNSAGVVAPVAGFLGLLAGMLTTVWFGWLGPLTLLLVFMLLSHLGLELLLRNNYATPGTPRTRLKAAIPRGLLIVAAVAGIALVPALVAVTGSTRGGMYDWPGLGDASPHFLIPLICILAILMAAAGATVTVIRRPGLNDAPEKLDRTLRRRSLFRIARTATGGLLAILAAALFNLGTAATPGDQSADSSWAIVGAACIVLAVTLCFYPAKAFTPADFMPAATTHTSLSK